MSEARIQIGHQVLTPAQAMAVRVAVTNFHMETGDHERAAEIGPISAGYNARLSEVLRMIFKEIAQART